MTVSLGLIAVIALWTLAYLTTRWMAESAAQVAHTQEVIAMVRGTAASLGEVEAAHRDYLISTHPQDLARYREESGEPGQHLEALRVLVQDNEPQLVRLDQLDTLLTRRILLLDTLAVAVSGAQTIRSVVSDEDSGRYLDEIGQVLTALEEEENYLLRTRLSRADSDAGMATRMVMATGIFTLLTVLGSGVVLNRGLSHRAKQSRELREALVAADAASAAKSQFLATISHEIRTPLNAVSGMSELLLETRLNSEQAEFARTVRANAETLSFLISDLLDSSKIEAGQVDLETVPFDLRETVEGVAEILVLRAEMKQVELVMDLAPDLPAQLIGDRNRLRQVLMNLMGNAVKFTERGQIMVRVRWEAVENGAAARLNLSVQDTGIGIPAEARERIFERFVQGDRSTVRRYGGTGLGLNISRSLLELMGGALSVESEVGEGSTFTIDLTLPIAPDVPTSIDGELLRGLDLLVVERNDVRRESVSAVLKHAGARVRPAASPEAAKAAIREGGGITERGAVLIGDVDGDADSIDLAKWVQENSPGRVVPVILICSLRSMMANQIGRHGIFQCVYKPVKQLRLLEAVAAATGVVEVQAAAAPPEQTRGPATPGSVLPRILLVEDHQDNWTLATRLLVGAGYTVDLAEDGAQAVERASAFQYDLILMDIELPIFDGIEATRRIRAQEGEEKRDRAPIVALTAHAVESVRTDALAAGMDDYTTKPIRKQQLLETCARWVDARPVVLIADDAPENHALITHYLGDKEYRLIYAANGLDVVEAFVGRRVSLIVLDMDMPIMTGFEATRAIRRSRGGENIPIIALTGYQGAEERQRCLEAGCTAFLTKPIDRAALVGAVAMHLDRSRVRRDGALLRRVGEAEPPAPDGLPTGRDAANSVRTLLARHDFAGIASYAKGIVESADGRELHKLRSVGEELVDSARQEDDQRVTWWTEQLASVLRDSARVLTVRQLLPTGPDSAERLDPLARRAQEELKVPLAAITLVDEETIWVVGSAGLPSTVEQLRHVPTDSSFCQHVVSTQEAVLVRDARTDPLVRENGVIQDRGLVAYAGVPLRAPDGTVLGSVCVLDTTPRSWTSEDVRTLEKLSVEALTLIEEIGRRREIALGGSGDNGRSAPPGEPTALVVDDDIADLLPGYVAARRENVHALRQMLADGDYPAIARLGHKMKGSGEGYGVPEISRFGRELERGATGAEADSVRELIDVLESYLSQLTIETRDGQVVPL